MQPEFPVVPAASPGPEAVPLPAGSLLLEVTALLARSPEELCEIEPGMGREEIHAILAKLFRRHNRAASSLDEQLRAEAEIMLQAIVDIRHRYLDAKP